MKNVDAFGAATLGILVLIIAYFALIITAPVGYFDIALLRNSCLDREVLFAIILSLKTATISALMALLLGVPVAYYLSRADFKGKIVIDTILDLPTAISPVALGSLLLIFFNLPPGTWVQEHVVPVVFSAAGIVVAQTTIVLALTIRLIKTVFDGIDPYYELMARLLGENRFRAFMKVTLPLAKRGIFSAFIMSWARALGEFGATVTLAGATKYKTETLPVAIYLNLASVQIDKAVVLIWFLLVVSFFVLLIVRYFEQRREV